MCNETGLIKQESETIFASWSIKIIDTYSWGNDCYLKSFNTTHSYLSLTEFITNEISILFYFEVGEKKTWSTKIFLKDGSGKRRHVQRNIVNGEKRLMYKIWKLSKKILLEELHEFLVNGVLTFNIVITDLNILALHKDIIKEKCIQTSRQKDDVPCLGSLSLDIYSLLEDGSTSDVVLVSDNNKFPAHRAVLSSRSEVFSAMFRSDMREKREGFVEITGIESSDLRLLLRYIYSGKVDDLTEELARRLYVVADQYGVHPLKKKCAAFLVESLTEENACSTLILADTYNDPDFKAFIIDYIAQRKEILETEEWFRTADINTKLGVEVFKAYIRKPEAVPNEPC